MRGPEWFTQKKTTDKKFIDLAKTTANTAHFDSSNDSKPVRRAQVSNPQRQSLFQKTF